MLKKIWIKFWTWTKNQIKKIWTWTKNQIKKIWTWTKNQIKKFWTWTKNQIKKFWTWTKNQIKNQIRKFWTWTKNQIKNQIKQFWIRTKNQIKQDLKSIFKTCLVYLIIAWTYYGIKRWIAHIDELIYYRYIQEFLTIQCEKYMTVHKDFKFGPIDPNSPWSKLPTNKEFTTGENIVRVAIAIFAFVSVSYQIYCLFTGS